MPECQCHGLNPDCYLCNGRGWVGDDIIIMKGRGVEGGGKSRRGRIFHFPTKAKQKAKIKSKCPYCGQTKIGLADHIRAKHPEESQTGLHKVFNSARALLQKKPNYIEEVSSFITPKRTHSVKAGVSGRIQIGSDGLRKRLGTRRSTCFDTADCQNAEQFLICPICKVWFKPRVFKRHIRNLHPEAQKSDWFLNLNSRRYATPHKKLVRGLDMRHDKKVASIKKLAHRAKSEDDEIGR